MLKLDQWDFSEFFSEAGILSKTCASKGLAVGPPISWETGWDLSNPLHLARVKELLGLKKPKVFWCSPECSEWVVEGDKLQLVDQEALLNMKFACESREEEGRIGRAGSYRVRVKFH